MNARYFKADVVNGVVEIDMVDYPDVDYMPFYQFMGALSNLDDDEVIYTIADTEQCEELDAEYGIQGSE